MSVLVSFVLLNSSHCYDTANFLRINVYLTQKIGEDMLWNIAVNDAGAEYDPLTLLRTRTMFGRPDWKAIYGQMRQAIESGQYIPGTKSQLKTTVGVSSYMWTFFGLEFLTLCTRPISAALVSLPRQSRKQPSSRLVLRLTLHSPRFAANTWTLPNSVTNVLYP